MHRNMFTPFIELQLITERPSGLYWLEHHLVKCSSTNGLFRGCDHRKLFLRLGLVTLTENQKIVVSSLGFRFLEIAQEYVNV